MIYVWILILFIVSFIWALVALFRERGRKEMDKAKEEISKGRVIFYSSSEESSSESS